MEPSRGWVQDGGTVFFTNYNILFPFASLDVITSVVTSHVQLNHDVCRL
jgi:hypothetical protein